ncbi:MAG: zinc ribbon domain-containing protein [Methanobrevibacter sp.]|nr:zinc ribbon domain-containing protein [Methanobrevibacter sp.]
MVYCRYCGEKNKDSSFKCSKCGKPLSLAPDYYPEARNSNTSTYTNKKGLNKEFSNDIHSNFNQKSIKSRYNNFNKQDNSFNRNENGNNQLNKLNRLSSSQNNYYEDNYRKNLKKPNKNHVEWDVVVATALLVIILTTILQRFFPRFGLTISLLFGLVYILIATKSKVSLFKAIPLAIIMIFAISAYFSL